MLTSNGLSGPKRFCPSVCDNADARAADAGADSLELDVLTCEDMQRVGVVRWSIAT